MSASRPPLPMQPAPRPRARVTAGEAEQLASASADLGFSRPISAPARPVDRAEPPPPTPAAPVRDRAAPKVAATPASDLAVLKLSVPESLWTALKYEALRRRVTVRYLVLEALAASGYALDLAAVPEDGRRLR